MKKLILSMALLVWSMAVLAQVHTAERGESLLSIAEKYHVSVSRLVEANPGVENLFYVGLKLNIPEPLAEDQPAALQQGNVVAPVQQNHVVASEIPQTKAAVQTQTNTVADKEDKPVSVPENG